MSQQKPATKKKYEKAFLTLYKGKEGKASYAKVNRSVTLNEGDCLILETKTVKLRSLEKNPKISEETREYIKEKINNIPDYVIGDLVLIESRK